MASAAEVVSSYSCRCLNVRIRASIPNTASCPPPQVAATADYSLVYVAEDGISVNHPQLALRIRTRGLPAAGSSRSGRYTSLTCLVCETLVYRVNHVVSVEVEGKDGPILPTEDWVDNEVMKSSTGWIEVHRGCLSEKDAAELQHSPRYSPLFSLVLPASTSSPASQQLETISKQPPEPSSYFSHMRPVFPPPPFTPTHAAFQHLSSVVASVSDKLRVAAGEEVASIVKQKTAELEEKEATLRAHTEILWRRYKEGIEKAEAEHPVMSPRLRHNSDTVFTANGISRTSSHGKAIPIRHFTPSPVPPRSAPASAPRLSWLSQSLATSTFYHPQATSSTNAASSASSNDLHSPLSLSGSSVTLVAPPAENGARNVLQYRRTNDDTINTAATYRFFALEDEMERRRHREDVRLNMQEDDNLPSTSRSRSPKTNGIAKTLPAIRGDPSISRQGQNTMKEVAEHQGPSGSSSKGKRKVTFDVQPAVVTITGGAESKEDQRSAADTGEMVFDLEDEAKEDREESFTPQTLPLIEQTLSPPKATRRRPQRSDYVAGLPASVAAVRPASLPTLSQARPVLPSEPPSVAMPEAGPSHSDSRSPSAPPSEDSEMDYPKLEIMRLVSASTPSHRSAWRRNGPAWQSFMNRHRHGVGGNVPEYHNIEADGGDESNDDDDDTASDITRTGIPGSMPVPVRPIIEEKPPLSLASYREGSSLTPPAPRPGTSAAAIRAERDRQRDQARLIDPGVMDFSVRDDDDDNQSISDPDIVSAGERGRRHALKIIQARSKLPEAGMWRSLA